VKIIGLLALCLDLSVFILKTKPEDKEHVFFEIAINFAYILLNT
jgi:hypothetical protein